MQKIRLRFVMTLWSIGMFVPGRSADAQTMVTVPATTVWVDTGVDVMAGQRLLLVATGQWSNGGSQPQFVGPGGWPDIAVPRLIAPRLPLAALVGRIGRRPFLVGDRYQNSAATTGRLYLSMNDADRTFPDNQGMLQVSITVLPSLATTAGAEFVVPGVFIPGDQFTALAGLVLGGGRLQLSQTGAGEERTIDGTPAMSYISFGPYLQGLGIKDFPVALQDIEYYPDQFVNTGGATILLQDLVFHKLVFIDRMRFLINNIHADFDNDLTVRLGAGEVLLDLRLHAPDPAARGEGNGYTTVLLIPIPLGWEDGLMPDLTIQNMVATLHLAPILEDGVLHLSTPFVELTGGIALSVADELVEDIKARILKEFETSLNAQLAKPAVKDPLETALTNLFLAGRPNTNVDVINIDDNGVEVIFKR